MHFVYGFCNRNAHATPREYEVRYPIRRHPGWNVLLTLRRNLRESGMLRPQHHVGRSRRGSDVEETFGLLIRPQVPDEFL